MTVYDRMPSAGRKLLMAGRGGLNLTHSEPLEPFLARYGTAADALRAAIEAFPPDALRAWAEALGQETFVGSSGRVFPRSMKASPLLRAWLRRLDAAGVRFALRHHWAGWDGRRLKFETPDGAITVEADATVLALGGASWPRLGSDGGWADALARAGVAIAPLQPSNCGFLVAWSDQFRRFAGQPLKRIALSFGDHTARGEAIITQSGTRGRRDLCAVAAAARRHRGRRRSLLHHRAAPRHHRTSNAGSMSPRGKQSISTFLRKALSLVAGRDRPAAGGDARQARGIAGGRACGLINAVPVRLTGIAPIARAISTAGGVRFDALDARFMLRDLPGVFVAGEMLDWEAPTGGYLLQACFATGVAAGRGVLEWLHATA